MSTDPHGLDLPNGKLTYDIIGCAIDVLNELGHGFHEKPYENALVLAFSTRSLGVEQQRLFPILYRGNLVGEYIPDLIVANEVIVDAKVVDKITDHERGQMLNYLRITGLKVGLILNFYRAKLEWERIVL